MKKILISIGASLIFLNACSSKQEKVFIKEIDSYVQSVNKELESFEKCQERVVLGLTKEGTSITPYYDDVLKKLEVVHYGETGKREEAVYFRYGAITYVNELETEYKLKEKGEKVKQSKHYFLNGILYHVEIDGTTIDANSIDFAYWKDHWQKSYEDLKIDKLTQRYSCPAKINDSSYNVFTSKDQRVNFFYKKNWTCKEVVTNEKIDCYPLERREEEYDLGLEQPSVFSPSVSIAIGNCAVDSSFENAEDSYFKAIKNYNGCRVLAFSDTLVDEEELDNILFTKETLGTVFLDDEPRLRTPKEKEWEAYKNIEYGFQLTFPRTLGKNILRIKQEGENFAVEGLNGIGREFKIPFKVGLNINNEKDLESFIKKEYGETCEVAEVHYEKPRKGELYPVRIETNSMEEGCWINWIVYLNYSPKYKRVVSIDVGHESPMIEPIEGEPREVVDYLHKTIDSFRFTD